MRGTASEPGVIPLAVDDLFNSILEEANREFLLRMSYMEIYNEEINDLLAPEHRKLQIHESIERGIFVAGLREEVVACAEKVLGLMEFGESHRHIEETNMNVYSSRSHTIFRMIIESREKKEDADSDNSCDAVRVSVLNLVDLAGSERVAKTGAEGVRLKEGSHINKSLMTLGTVIKKLSEGVESQGGHVPYRDSKLTRILQPALGGNANTAMICNITLAQAHNDETKSSLQFASRALRVTNCVHVNEILTDAALLKRQKKEIEELRATLLGSHSEHHEEEILSLRNTLLKVELERERMALALEEEKKAQAEQEKRLEEQAKKIENLSSMVLCSSKTENNDILKKEKRRETWCPGNLSRQTFSELNSKVKEKASLVKPGRLARYTGPLLPFENLDEAAMDKISKEDPSKNNLQEDCVFPNHNSLMHVTSRRKAPMRKKSLHREKSELTEILAEYEDLLVQFEAERTMNEIHLAYLRKRLAEADLSKEEKCEDSLIDENRFRGHLSAGKGSRESEAIVVIKQLQEKITMLDLEKSSSQQNLDCIVDLATEQTISAKEKYDEEVTKHHELEKSGFLSQIEALLKEVSCLSSCSLAREKESIRKDLEKTKAKLKDMESKMKITMQERTKLEGEKACMERENKLLRGQMANLERDISNSVVGRRNNSVADRNSVAAEQEEYKKLEVLAFEMEATIASLDEELAVISGEKEEANLKAESLASDLYTATRKLELSNVELATLKEEVSSLQSSLEEYKSLNQKLESSVNVLIQEKDELAMQLTDNLLHMEEEKTIWFTKEKASIEAIEDKSKSHNAEVALLTHQMSAVRTDLEFCRNQCKILEDKLTFSEQNAESEKKCSVEKSAEIDKLREDLLTSNDQFQRTREILNSKLEMLSSEHQCTCDKLEKLQMELVRFIKEREDLIALLGVLEAGSLLSKESQILTTKHEMENLSGRLSFLAAKIQKDRAISNKEMAKLRMRLRYTDLKLDAYRDMYNKTWDELVLMNKKYEAAAEELKQKIAFYGVEVLRLKKELAAQAVRSS